MNDEQICKKEIKTSDKKKIIWIKMNDKWKKFIKWIKIELWIKNL